MPGAVMVKHVLMSVTLAVSVYVWSVVRSSPHWVMAVLSIIICEMLTSCWLPAKSVAFMVMLYLPFWSAVVSTVVFQ